MKDLDYYALSLLGKKIKANIKMKDKEETVAGRVLYVGKDSASGLHYLITSGTKTKIILELDEIQTT